MSCRSELRPGTDLVGEQSVEGGAELGRSRAIVRNLPAVAWSATGVRTTFVSPQVTQICGFTPGDLFAADGSLWIERAHPDDVDRVEAAYRSLATTGAPLDIEYRWQHKHGQWIWVRTLVSINQDGWPAVDGLLFDVSDRKLLEQQIQEIQRSAPVGHFTSGIAHDFNNILAVILGNDDLLLEGLAADDPRRVEAEAILRAAHDAAALTRQLLAYSRRQSFTTTVVDLNSIVQSIQGLLRRVISEDIALAITVTREPADVRVDAGQIEQVIMNLAANARDAMPAGGRLTIETRRVRFDGAMWSTGQRMPAGDYAVLVVRDTGCGMSEEVKQRVFEPLFTTKKSGGTGLGLSTCASIVKQIGGYVTVDSEPGAGSAFSVYLPVVERPALPASPDHATTSTAALAGSETILVVEDDERVRVLVQRILARLGYRVLAAENAQAALAVCQAHDGPIDLVLSDIVVPDLSGREIVRRVQDRSPNTRALFMSGHTVHASLDEMTHGDAHFLQKPFVPRTLAQKVREVLDA
jgi:two-component system, cell cycle sensor histidine kinase and response regulator CckA